MTREIKFRMWSEEAGKYFRDPQVFECLMQQYCHDNNAAGLKHDHVGDGMVFEQYTGLKDKGGKEIYEGDIVKFTNGVIAFVVWLPLSAGFALGIPKTKSNMGLPGVCSCFEVVGNINEDHELIA